MTEKTHETEEKVLPFLVDWRMIQALTNKCERSCRDELADMRAVYNTPRPNIDDMANYYHTTVERLKEQLKLSGYYKFIKRNIY